MILGVGVDVFAPSRLARLLHEDPDSAGEFFSPAELGTTEGSAADLNRLATLFAIKEAAFKALAPPPSAGAHWREVTVQLGDAAPVVRLTGNLAANALAYGPVKLHAASSGWGDLVVALVVAETAKDHPDHRSQPPLHMRS